MDGDERVRFCHQCQKNVYNLTVMDEVEVRALVERTEGKFCGRLYQRTDGTALTADCPVGLRRVARAAARRARQVMAAVLLVLVGYAYAIARWNSDDSMASSSSNSRLVETLQRWTFGPRQVVLGELMPVPRR